MERGVGMISQGFFLKRGGGMTFDGSRRLISLSLVTAIFSPVPVFCDAFRRREDYIFSRPRMIYSSRRKLT